MTYHFTAASIAPIIGCLLTIVRSTIPLREVFTIRKDHRIGVRAVACQHGCSLRIAVHFEVVAGVQSNAIRCHDPEPYWLGGVCCAEH